MRRITWNEGTKRKKRIKGCLFLVAVLFVMLAPFMQMGTTTAAGLDFDARIAQLKVKFPSGKYWNKVGKSADNSDGYTDSPCTRHNSGNNDCIYDRNGCTCNHFADLGHVSAAQCMGFANKLGHDVFGDTTWIRIDNPNASQIADIKVGDIVRTNYGGHSVFVISRSGNLAELGEANYGGGCVILWGRTIDLTKENITYYERASNYDEVMNGNMPETESESGTTNDFTGWKKTADGQNYQYYKKGTLQKKKWLTIKKKKYYVDKLGYRVTDFYDVKGFTYYFNEKGVLQKKKWFEKQGKTYYCNEDGIVLKSQWLYYKGSLVYVTSKGNIAKKEIIKIGSKKYYFNGKGKRSKGFKKYNGKYYYTDSKGVIQKKKWITKGGKKYYLQKNGVRAQSQLLKIGKYKYYFEENGQMAKKKKVQYKNSIYKVDKKGRCKYVGPVEANGA